MILELLSRYPSTQEEGLVLANPILFYDSLCCQVAHSCILSTMICLPRGLKVLFVSVCARLSLFTGKESVF